MVGGRENLPPTPENYIFERQNMKNIIYHHINMVKKEDEIEYLKNLKNEGFFLVGVEITEQELTSMFHLTVDPQHDPLNKSDMTSLEYAFNNQENIFSIVNQFDKVFLATVKPDMDSIGTMAILSLLLRYKFQLDGDMILRLKAIAKSDRHGRNNWKHRREDYFYFNNHNIHGLPSGLAYMTSDHKLDMSHKIDNMISYLTHGTFENLDKYNDAVAKNLKKSTKSTHIDVIIPKKLAMVMSNYRGAVAYGYKSCPVVIARNNNFIFGTGISKLQGRKITIAQYEDNKYVDLTRLKYVLNELEEGWGGSSAIIGSPQDRPCKLDDNSIIELVKKYLY